MGEKVEVIKLKSAISVPADGRFLLERNKMVMQSVRVSALMTCWICDSCSFVSLSLRNAEDKALVF